MHPALSSLADDIIFLRYYIRLPLSFLPHIIVFFTAYHRSFPSSKFKHTFTLGYFIVFIRSTPPECKKTPTAYESRITVCIEAVSL